nr:ATP-binding protein [Burkholderiaceae bacterium]
DGSRRVLAVQPLQTTQWRVVVAAQPATIYGPMQRVLATWALLVAVVLVAAWWLAARLSQRLSQPLRQMAEVAARPDSVSSTWPRPAIRELAQLSQSLRDATLAARERNEAVVQRRVAEQGEAQARRMADELRTREAQLRLALNAGRLGIWQLELATGRVRGDAHFAALWGVDPAAPDHDAATLFKRIHDDDRDAVQRGALVDAVEGDGHYAGEFRIVLPDGRVRWILAFADVTRDAAGRASALIGVNADATARKEMEQQLRDKSAALEEAGRRKDHFLAMLGHELRNPLSPISMAAESLRMSAHDPQRTQRAAEVISRQVQHMVRLIDDLLDVARITQGKIHLQQMPVDLAAVVRDAVETARPLIDARRHRLAVTPPPVPMTVLGDPTRLVQVVVNLLTNAAKYTDEGGHIALTVSRAPLEGEPGREQAVIEVRDDGIGLSREMLDVAFDAFSQSASALGRAQGGLGMGLAVVRRLVQMHGGQVLAASAGAGHGATFTVMLPLMAASARPMTPAPGVPAAMAAPSGVRVLVVDDNQDSADSLAQLLTLLGHEVRVAYDGASALAMVPTFRPQAGILDIGLPDMDGRDLAQALRDGADGGTMRLIAATGYGKLDDSEPTAFDNHLVKPVDIAEVQALLAQPQRTAEVTAPQVS